MKKSILHTIAKQWIFLFLLLPILAGCAARGDNQSRERSTLIHTSGMEPARGQSPLFLIPGWQHPFNRIGKVRAEKAGNQIRIFIDPDTPVFYHQQFSFASALGQYTNQVFRIHFSEIPFSLFPFHLGAGNNVGLLVIITQDHDNRPILITTVNTCGCYLSFTPTNYLPREAYPDGWPKEEQSVYGEILPARLDMGLEDASLLITIRPGVHRVMEMQAVKTTALPPIQRIQAERVPLTALKNLPLPQGDSTSMFYQQWPLRGHVKGAIKPWESLFLGLISLDFYVGMDKEYGRTEESGNPFYTSLKPWNRNSSDMNNFAAFLKFYGWKL